MKNVLCGLVILALLPFAAHAGENSNGGGSKHHKKSSCCFKNCGKSRCAIICNNSCDPCNETVQSFKKRGGRILDCGETTSYECKEGKHHCKVTYLCPKQNCSCWCGKVATWNIHIGYCQKVVVNCFGHYNSKPTCRVNRSPA
jgi:hypothetical protein